MHTVVQGTQPAHFGSIKCPRENSSNTLTWTRRTSSRDGYDDTSKDSGFSAASAAKPKPAFSGRAK